MLWFNQTSMSLDSPLSTCIRWLFRSATYTSTSPLVSAKATMSEGQLSWPRLEMNELSEQLLTSVLKYFFESLCSANRVANSRYDVSPLKWSPRQSLKPFINASSVRLTSGLIRIIHTLHFPLVESRHLSSRFYSSIRNCRASKRSRQSRGTALLLTIWIDSTNDSPREG